MPKRILSRRFSKNLFGIVLHMCRAILCCTACNIPDGRFPLRVCIIFYKLYLDILKVVCIFVLSLKNKRND